MKAVETDGQLAAAAGDGADGVELLSAPDFSGEPDFVPDDSEPDFSPEPLDAAARLSVR
jgi:hypothetical protein